MKNEKDDGLALPWEVEADDDGTNYTQDFDFKPSDFDLFTDSDGVPVNPIIERPRIYRETLTRRVLHERAEELAAKIDITPGARYFSFVSGNFIFGDILEALVNQGKLSPKRIVLMTLSMSAENIHSLDRIRRKTGASLDLILSDYFYSHERKTGQLVWEIKRTIEPEGFRLAFAGTHSKIILVETTDGTKVAFHGSANLRSSRNIEQLSIEADAELYDFINEYCEKILAAYELTGKNPRAGKLWDILTKEEPKHED